MTANVTASGVSPATAMNFHHGNGSKMNAPNSLVKHEQNLLHSVGIPGMHHSTGLSKQRAEFILPSQAMQVNANGTG